MYWLFVGIVMIACGVYLRSSLNSLDFATRSAALIERSIERGGESTYEYRKFKADMAQIEQREQSLYYAGGALMLLGIGLLFSSKAPQGQSISKRTASSEPALTTDAGEPKS